MIITLIYSSIFLKKNRLGHLIQNNVTLNFCNLKNSKLYITIQIVLDSFEFFEFQNFNVHVHVTINTYLLDCTAPELLLVKYIQCQLCIFFYPQYRCISDFNIKQTTTKTTSNIVKILKLSLFSFKKYFVLFFSIRV